MVKECKDGEECKDFDLPTEDVDATLTNNNLEDNIMDDILNDATTPKKWYETSQFKLLLASWIVPAIVGFLMAKGLVLPENSALASGMITTALIGLAAVATNQFMKTRGRIAEIKAQAAAAEALHAKGISLV